MSVDRETLARAFRKEFGAPPRFFSRAPGRVNLIGEHTDYNGGFVMPMAIDRDVALAFRPVEQKAVRAFSLDYGGRVEFGLQGFFFDEGHRWSNYIRGVAKVLSERFDLKGIDCVVSGDVPVGSGLSSSAAFEVACALAFARASGAELPGRDLALLAQRAENEFVGVRCGIMDQFVSVHASEGEFLLLDCRDLSYEYAPLPEGGAVVVVDTGVKHELASSEYNDRRAECERAAEKLLGRKGLLREVSREVWEERRHLLDEPERGRAEHVLAENERTLNMKEALASADLARAGGFMLESHESLAKLYGVSCAELDALVEIASSVGGVFGSRMTGGGFGGCTVSLIEGGAVEELRAAVTEEYPARTGRDAVFHVFSPAGGAEVVEL